MLKLAGVKEGDVVYDLGCGDGRIVVTAVHKFKAKKGFGLDLNPERIKDSLETAKKAGVQDRVKFQQGDVLKIEDVSEANVVTLYLLPEVNLRLAPMLKKTLKPGSRIVSHDFDMGDWAADKKIEVKGDSGRDHTIYLWTIPGAKKEEPKKVTEPKKSPPMPSAELADELADEPKTIVVPYVPTPQKVVDEMLKLADVKEGDVVYDLGCGDGRIVVTALKKFNAKKGYGIDLNPERVKDSYENAKKAGVEKNVKFEQGDVLKIKDVSEANVVTLYLLPDVNLRLAPMLKKTLKPGSRIVSHDFHMGDWKAEKKIQVVDEDGLHHDIYLWTIPGKKK
jgi:ribosomal protein L11 methylase PrmA